MLTRAKTLPPIREWLGESRETARVISADELAKRRAEFEELKAAMGGSRGG